jgi:hypothetical protein
MPRGPKGEKRPADADPFPVPKAANWGGSCLVFVNPAYEQEGHNRDGDQDHA